MITRYELLSNYNIEFKQLISGPAPVGRVLNYVKLIGEGKLFHKNGNRDLNLTNNIGSAWCTEFMCGLGLCHYVVVPNSDKYPLYLTHEGNELYELLKNSPSFDEGSQIEKCRAQLKGYSSNAYEKLKEIFVNSIVCRNLYSFLVNMNQVEFDKNEFYDTYFGTFKRYYTHEDYIIGSNTKGATTGANRVPSLVQFCEFFDFVLVDKAKLLFYPEKFKHDNGNNKFIEITQKVHEEIKKEDEYNEIVVENLEDKYGINGVVAREVVTRNSNVQRIFRNNLIAKYGHKCAMCNKKIDEVLNASHIKPASICNVNEKADCENGLLLCALHDRLFDRMLITFDAKNGKLIYSDVLKNLLDEYQLSENFKLEDKFLTAERKAYLKWHNDEFSKKN